MKSIRVLLVDDHATVRAGIRSLLQEIVSVEVVAEAGSGQAALDLIEKHRPDVVLMDIAMPDLNGLATTARAVHEFPTVRVIILSMYANEEYVIHALRAGASGYLLKDVATDELAKALQAVARGETYFSPAISFYENEFGFEDHHDGSRSWHRRLAPDSRQSHSAPETLSHPHPSGHTAPGSCSNETRCEDTLSPNQWCVIDTFVT